MQDVYDQYHSQNFEIISICIEDALDSVKYYARMYSFLFLMDADQSTWQMYYQGGFTPIWYVLEPNDQMIVHGWTEVFDSTQLRTWIEECISVAEGPDRGLSSIEIGPNPSTGKVAITAKQPFSAEIYDVRGSLIDKINSQERRCVWDGRGLPEGVYLFRVKAGDNSRFSKVAIIR